VTSEGEFNPIDDAPAGEIGDTRQQVDRLSAELRSRDAAVKSQQVLIASLQARLAEASKELERLSSENTQAELRLSLEQLRRENALTKQEAAKVRNTISYQLGHALIHGFKSWSSAIALPRTLMAIHLEAKRREKSKAAHGRKPGAQPANPLASGTPSATAAHASTEEGWCHPYVKLQTVEVTSSGPQLFAIGSSLGNPADDAVTLTPQNFEDRIAQSKGSTVRVYLNQNLAGTGWGNLFDFAEMQSFKRFVVLRRLVLRKGGRVEIIREGDSLAPLLSYIGD
jgi:multidrug efflux pump subunit AcrA (membrane-fusion protein)